MRNLFYSIVLFLGFSSQCIAGPLLYVDDGSEGCNNFNLKKEKMWAVQYDPNLVFTSDLENTSRLNDDPSPWDDAGSHDPTNPVPEPTSLLLLGGGCGILALVRRFRSQQ